MMNINRSDLLNDIYKFACEGSGLIVGKPGIGKSHLLRELRRKFLNERIPCLTIQIDNAYDASDDAIQQELRLSENWIGVLKDVNLESDVKAVLIFDAFDAARDGAKRSGFLSQIKKAKVQLADKWNILVSVRSYDAAKSKDLQKVFGQKDGYANARQKSIPEFSNPEIESFLDDHEPIKHIYNQSGNKLKEIIHVPFFLKIYVEIINKQREENTTFFKNIHSETQLLDLYWNLKITQTDQHLLSENFVSKLCNALVTNKSLSFSKKDFALLHQENQITIFNYLRSENIIDEVGIHQGRLAFSHNIFFDYAISRYTIPENEDALAIFLSENVSSPFFFRPSFVYFFTTLWYEHIARFWSFYKILSTDHQKQVQLLLRLTVNSVIINEYESIDELTSILNNTNLNQERFIAQLLQSIHFLREECELRDVKLMHHFSQNLKVEYFIEFCTLLEHALRSEKWQSHSLMGQIARITLNYALSKRNSDHKELMDRIGAIRGLKAVAATYSTNTEESHRALSQLFPIIKEPNFEISYFTYLCDSLEKIVKHDPQLVSEVYFLVFGHSENSSAKTQLGGSVIMSLTSNRKQDFDLCYYSLERFLPDFLKEAPQIATKTAITIANLNIIQNEAISTEPFYFKYKEQTLKFVPDYLSRRYGTYSPDRAESLINSVLEFLEGEIQDGNTALAKEIVEIYISCSQAGYLWKSLFRSLEKYPHISLDEILAIITIPKVLTEKGITEAIITYTKKVIAFMSDDQIRHFEDTIFEAFSPAKNYAIQELLSVIPSNKLQTEKAIQFIADHGRSNVSSEPKFTTTVSRYSVQEWLGDSGVDLETKTNKLLADKVSILEQFTRSHLNDRPSLDENKEVFNTAVTVFKLGKDATPETLRYTSINAASKVIAILAKAPDNIPDDVLPEFETIIHYAYQYKGEFIDEDYNGSPSSGYAPTPIMEAADALIALFNKTRKKGYLKMIRSASVSTNSIVRFQIIKQLQDLYDSSYSTYKDILWERLRNETDNFIYSFLLAAVKFSDNNNKEKEFGDVVQIVNTKLEQFKDGNNFIDTYSDFLLWGHYFKYEIATQTLLDIYNYPALCQRVIFRLSKTIQTFIPQEEFVKHVPSYKDKIAIISAYLDYIQRDLSDVNYIENLESLKSKSAIELLDEIVMRIYFTLESEQRIQNSIINAVENNRKTMYYLFKDILERIISISGKVTSSGLILGHTAHYFIQCLEASLDFDPKDILHMVANITRYSVGSGYIFDSMAINEIVKLTEKILADHRNILLEDIVFEDLLAILNIYVTSGWIDALKLLWRLDEIFK